MELQAAQLLPELQALEPVESEPAGQALEPVEPEPAGQALALVAMMSYLGSQT